MLFTWGTTLTQFILPIFIFSSSLLSGLQHQEFLGLFGQEYQTRYDHCLEQYSIQQEEITQLKVALSETEVKLKDVDIFRESLGQREDVLKTRSENLKKRESDLDHREELLEQKIFEFTKQVEEVAKNGGKVEQILANNQMLTNRVQFLEKKLDEERELAREDLKNERSSFDKRLEGERGINRKLQHRIDQDNQFVLIIEVILLVIVSAVSLAILLLYINWRRGRIVPQPSQIIETEIVKQTEQLDINQNPAPLTSSELSQE